MVLTQPTVESLASQCAPSVAPQTLAAVALAESGFDPLAIGVNGPKPLRLRPASAPDAIRLADTLQAEGANLDLGLAQINSANLGRLGLTLATSFDPCRSLAAAATLIRTGYMRAGPRAGSEQPALWSSLSLYNTGDPQRGFRNGYVAKVLAAAGRLSRPRPQSARTTAHGPWHASTSAFVILPLSHGDQP